jgi:hypothetical protein
MDFIFGLPPLAFVLIALALGVGAFIATFYWTRNWDKGRGLAEYKTANPNCARGSNVTCHSCGAANIYLRRNGGGFGYILNSHVCRQCGTELYRSKTRA